MKKHIFYLLLIGLILNIFIVSGCSGDVTLGNNSGYDDNKGYSMLLGPVTDNNVSGTSVYLVANACSNSGMSSISGVSITTPWDSVLEMGGLSGSIIGNNYYYADKTGSQGKISDPLSESAQRQFGTGPIEASPPLDGDYTGVIGDKKKEFSMKISDYMTEINEANVSISGPGGSISSLGGSTITVSNQEDTSFKYLCVIYNNSHGSGVYDNIWASDDIRYIDWVDTASTKSFFDSLDSPSGGQVSFDVPGGILDPEEGSVMVIMAVDSDNLDSNTSGDFKTLVFARSILHMNVNVY